MIKIPSFIFIIIFISITGFAQIMQPGSPLSGEIALRKQVKFSSFQQKDIFPETDSKQYGQPLLAGYTIPFTEKVKPEWEEISENQFVARIGIAVQDARAINLYFSNFNLKGDEQVFIYNPGRNQIIGALTEANNGDLLATAFVAGDSLVLELNSKTKSGEFPFEIAEIGVSIHEINYSERGFGDAGSCEILVNCPEGEDWQNEKNGVARVLVKEGSSLYWCSGSLVNNTKQDGTPYFLTANHCGVNSSTADYSQWVFYFQYESPDCQFPASEPPLLTTVGATKLASASGETGNGSDFKLLLLKDEVPKNYQPYYNGWNRLADPASSGVDIHHPEGDLKMISTFLSPAVSADYLGVNPNPNGHYWKIVWAPTDGGYGVTEGGSSGSPLFNSQGQIVGALTGGRASCANQEAPDYFGKFSYSWNSNGSDSASKLSVWLAPGNPGITFLNGTNLDTAGITADFRADFTDILIGGTVSFVNNSSGNINQYKWYFPGGYPDFSEAEVPPTVQYNSAGNFDVILEVSSSTAQNQLIRYQYITVSPAISQNPAVGKYILNFGKLVPDDLQIEVFDINGQNINFYLEKKATSVIVNLSPFADGIYFIRTMTGDVQQTYKAMLERGY